MASSPTESATPFSDYTSSRSNRGLDIDVLDVYILKHNSDPVLVLLPVSRIGTYNEFLSVIRADLGPSHSSSSHNPNSPLIPDPPAPLVYTLDPYMTMSLLRPSLWPDLIPHLRGKRLLVLPSDSPQPPAPPPHIEEKLKRPGSSSWTSYLTPNKSRPTSPETTRVSVDSRNHKLPALPPKDEDEHTHRLPLPPPAPMPPPAQTPQANRTAPEVFYTPETSRIPEPTYNNPRRTKVGPPPSSSASAATSGPQRVLRPLTRTESFLKPPEFGFDISLWCRFSPTYKPGALMHVQFREITLQVVPSQPGGIDVTAFLNKAASAITNMLRRQGMLRMTIAFRELVVRPTALRLALEDWASAGGLGVSGETLGSIVEPVVLFCEVSEVEFGGKRRGEGRSDERKREDERRKEEEDRRREEEWREEERMEEERREEMKREELRRREEARREEARRKENEREEPKMEMKPKKGKRGRRVQVESEDEVE